MIVRRRTYGTRSRVGLQLFLAFSLCTEIAWAGLVVQYDPSANYETFIVNTELTTTTSIGYSILSPSGLLDSTGWQSIEDQAAADATAVISSLGTGAIFFSELSATNSNLSEGNLTRVGTWQPNSRFSIGFPFGTTALDALNAINDSSFVYLDPSINGGTVEIVGSISAIPEPGGRVYLCLMLVVTCALRRKRWRVSG